MAKITHETVILLEEDWHLNFTKKATLCPDCGMAVKTLYDQLLKDLAKLECIDMDFVVTFKA